MVKMRWTVKHGDILDEPADILVCSANVFLNLSGGVGGALLLRYGDQMQQELRHYLADRGGHFVRQGEVVACGPCRTPYKAVLHAVAVDAFYESSPKVIESVVLEALRQAAALGVRKVALAAVGTGYGRLTMQDFAQGIRPLLGRNLSPIEEVVVCLRNDQDAAELQAALPP
jgi:O-acetyl-ADP-ribose deacetylase